MVKMERLTTRHSGVAVIKDKSKLKEAMEKLARIEEIEEDDKTMSEHLEEMAAYICDSVCKYTQGSSQEELDEYCEECKLERFLQMVQLKYDEICDFDNAQCMLLMKKYKNFILCDECQYCKVGEEYGIAYRWCDNKDGLDGHLEPGTGCTRGMRR